MKQLNDFADPRIIVGCIYCGGRAETRDHVPSKVLLDRPFPYDLPVVDACAACNNAFSLDEEYFACLIGSICSGSTDPNQVRRLTISNILRRNTGLRSRLEQAKKITEGQTYFEVETSRVESVLLKLARGHAAYELSALCRQEPSKLSYGPLSQMSKEQADEFEDLYVTNFFPEVGSRGMQRCIVTQITVDSPSGIESNLGVLVNDWVDVQEDQYRYLCYQDSNGVRVKIVIGEYFYSDVSWSRE
jgi:hypothetical protein